MGNAKKGGSDSTSSTSSSVANNQVGASEGALAFGAGAYGNTVISTNNDAGIIAQAGDAISHLASDANSNVAGVAKTSIAAQLASQGNALSFGEDVVGQNSNIALQTIQGAQNTVQESNAILERLSNGYASKLLDNTGVAPQTLVQDSQKTLIYGALIIGAVVIFVFNGKKAA